MEIIGRFIVMLILMAAAFGVGVFFALLVYVLLRKRAWQRPTIVAGLFPPAVMAYLLICLIGSGILSAVIGTPDFLFGDINEPLPNGFYLRALDKMPEAGRIEKPGNMQAGVAWVSELQTSGPIVLGKYDYTYFSRTSEESERNFFSFDTRSGTTHNFSTDAELASATNTNLHFTPTSSFRGPEPASRIIATNIMFLVAVVPPIGLSFWLLMRLRSLLRQV